MSALEETHHSEIGHDLRCRLAVPHELTEPLQAPNDVPILDIGDLDDVRELATAGPHPDRLHQVIVQLYLVAEDIKQLLGFIDLEKPAKSSRNSPQ